MDGMILEFTVTLLRETELAILVTDDPDTEGVWIAKSLVENTEDLGQGVYEISLPEWVAIDKGFV